MYYRIFVDNFRLNVNEGNENVIPVTERTGGESFPPFTARSRCSIKQNQTLLNNKARGYIKEFESIRCTEFVDWKHFGAV